ncbi:MAG: phosphoserine transaminase [Bacteriovoracaceae bacterium]|nr:phosphoserine transaminase [Bacteriovoracaceae bacterium]
MFENFKVPAELVPSDPRFGSGPSLIPLNHLQSLIDLGPNLLGTSHRKAPIKNMVKECQEGLMSYFNVPSDYLVVMGNGGATYLFDALALGMVQKKITHFTCGEFSQKWFKSSKKVPWIQAEEVAAEYGTGINAKDCSDSDVIATTLNETSTGVEINDLPKVHDDALLMVDATSGAGQVPCDVSKTDVFYFSPQKVFASEGGLWVAIMSPKAVKRALEMNEDKTRYIPEIMNWKLAITNAEKNQTYNTPAIISIWLLKEQVNKMIKEGGYKAAQEYAQKKAKLVYGWGEEMSYLSCYIEQPEFRSTAVACINVDDKYNVEPLLKKLTSENIVHGIEAYRKLGKNQFRISLFHNVSFEDLEKLTKLLSAAIEAEM